MKRTLCYLLLLAFLLPLSAITIPRVYVQKLTLEDGSLPKITQIEKSSAEEYVLRAWMQDNPEEVISTETHPIHTIAVKEVGKEGIMVQTAVVSVQLGNFKRQWLVGDILHLVITHKASGKCKGWQVEIPSGTNLIRKLEEAIIIPPSLVKKP